MLHSPQVAVRSHASIDLRRADTRVSCDEQELMIGEQAQKTPTLVRSTILSAPPTMSDTSSQASVKVSICKLLKSQTRRFVLEGAVL